jgi:hypothetical protein
MTRSLRNRLTAAAFALPLLVAPPLFAQSQQQDVGAVGDTTDTAGTPFPSDTYHRGLMPEDHRPMDRTDKPDIPTDQANPNGSQLPDADHPAEPSADRPNTDRPTEPPKTIPMR